MVISYGCVCVLGGGGGAIGNIKGCWSSVIGVCGGGGGGGLSVTVFFSPGDKKRKIQSKIKMSDNDTGTSCFCHELTEVLTSNDS